MATTTYAPSLSADVSRYIADDLLELSLIDLVVYEHAEKITLPKGNGTSYTMSRYSRVPLPPAPTLEGVPPVAVPLIVTQATVQLSQWSGLINVTDVARATTKHEPFEVAKNRLAMMFGELMERNTYQALFGFPNINYVNSRGSRASLLSTDVLNPQELLRASLYLKANGVPRMKGPKGPDVKKSMNEGQPKALSEPRSNPHYVGVMHDFVEGDLLNNPQIQLASAYSSMNRLYNGEFGQFYGIRLVSSNMVPFFTGLAAITGTGSTTGGTLATGNYQIIVTQSDSIFGFEQIIAQQSGNINIASGSTGSISVTLPAATGYTFNVYISAVGSTTVANLATSASGPTQGSLQGQATQLAPNQTIILTGIGVAKTPPAAPATGVTIYPTWIFGEHAYACVTLEDLEVFYLDKAEKVDPINQQNMVSGKFFNGTFIKNSTFAIRIESASQFINATG